MERFVCDSRWRMGFGWTVGIAAFIAVVVFGAPAMTFAAVLAGEMLFVTFLTWRYPDREERIRSRR